MSDHSRTPMAHGAPFPTLGDWIRLRRRALDFTQDMLAERLGYATATLQKIERGTRRPSHELAARLADVLQITPDEREAFLLLARATPLPAQLAASPSAAMPRTQRQPLAPPLPLIGRSTELAAIQEKLCTPEGRLVTLTGPGGIGKTTLALHIAAWAASERSSFPDGAAIVPLAATTAAGDMPRGIAAALGVQLDGSQDAADQLLASLHGWRALLVLDNLEQLLGPDIGVSLAALLARILAEAPDLRILATSRERLRLPQEWVVPLHGLALPIAARRGGATSSDAVALFLDRARRARADFEPDQEQLAAIATLCRRLDGLPLAIELAAAWCRALVPTEIVAEIDRALDFLASTERVAAPEQRGMRASLDRSWQLLSADEQRLLARLAVFHAGCERDAATAVAGASLFTLTALIDKSLLRHETRQGVTRYTLHELVRQYAQEQLARDQAKLMLMESRHCSYYADLLQRAVQGQGVALAPEAQAAVERDMPNLHAAWARVAVGGTADEIMALARNLWLLYESKGWVEEGLARFGQAIAIIGQRPGLAVAAGLLRSLQGYYLVRTGRPLDARSLLAEDVARAEASGPEGVAATLRLNLGMAEHRLGAFDAAQAQFTAASQLAARAGDRFTAAWADMHLGSLALDRGDFPAATRHLSAFHDVWRGQTYSVGAGCSIAALAELARLEGRTSEAAVWARQGMLAATQAHDRFVIGLCLGALGVQIAEQGDLDEARYLLTEGAEILRALGDRWHLGSILGPLMYVEARRAAGGAARRVGQELLRLAHDGMAMCLADVCYGLAILAAQAGRAPEAHALLDILERQPASYDIARLAARLRGALPPDTRTQPAGGAAPQAAALITWLEAQCAEQWAALPQAAAPPDALPPPSGWLAVPETGETLSPREVEVLRLLMGGASNPAIAAALIISPYTVKHHVAHILQKLGVSSRTEAAMCGRTLGLSPIAPPVSDQ